MNSTYTINKERSEAGFTIVELMIALSILSVILLVSTIVMTQIGKLYTKGVMQANLQNTTRNVMQDITSAIEFSGAPIYKAPSNSSYPAVRALCIGTTRYTYVIGKELGVDYDGTSTSNVLWRDSITDPTTCTVSYNIVNSTPTSGYEMMPEHTRLTNLGVDNSGNNVYKFYISAAYGDSDLMNVGPANSTDPSQSFLPTCKGGVGSQFCASSTLNTTVARRVN